MKMIGITIAFYVHWNLVPQVYFFGLVTLAGQ